MESETVEHKKSTSELKEGVSSIAAILNKHKAGELYFGSKTTAMYAECKLPTPPYGKSARLLPTP